MYRGRSLLVWVAGLQIRLQMPTECGQVTRSVPPNQHGAFVSAIMRLPDASMVEGPLNLTFPTYIVTFAVAMSQDMDTLSLLAEAKQKDCERIFRRFLKPLSKEKE